MNLTEIFQKDWSDDAEISAICSSIYWFLKNSPKQDHYSFSQIRDASGSGNDAKLARALLYLSGPRLNIVKFVFFIEDGEGVKEVLPNEMGELLDEVTGAPLPAEDLMTGFEAGVMLEQASI